MTIEWALGLVGAIVLLLLGWLKADTGRLLDRQQVANGRLMKLECWRDEHTRLHRRFNGATEYLETTNFGE